ncbi:MAG: hypothetical protein ABIU77_18035 [Ferruginibacter sp.]
MYLFLNIFICFSIGCFYSFTELLAKFKNAEHILKINWGIVYIIFNGLLSVLAYFIIKSFNFNPTEYVSVDGKKVVVAGISSMVIIRSWLISVPVPNKSHPGNHKKKDTVVDANLAPLIQVLMSYVEKEFDIKKAKLDYQEISKIMKGVNFDKARFALPITFSNLLVTFTKQDGEEIAKSINDLAKKSIDDESKLINLGLILKDYVKFDLLKTVIEDFKTKNESSLPVDQLDELLKLFETTS